LLYFVEDLADLVFDGVRAGGAGFEALEVASRRYRDPLQERIALAADHGIYVAREGAGLACGGPRRNAGR